MKKGQFAEMLQDLAAAWTRNDPDAVCAAFSADVHYSDPTRYAFRNLAELRAFFDADAGEEQKCDIHATVFDEDQQLGAAEYTYDGKYRYHGLVLIQVVNDKIASWREYQHVDDRSRTDFIKGV